MTGKTEQYITPLFKILKNTHNMASKKSTTPEVPSSTGQLDQEDVKRPEEKVIINLPLPDLTDDPLASELQNVPIEQMTFEVSATESESRTDSIPPAEAVKIVKAFAEKYKTTTQTALAGITKLVQDGGTNASKKQLKRTVNRVEFDIADLRSAITFHHKSGTVRKLAKSLRSSIAYIAAINNWPGPLVRDLLRAEPQLDISLQEEIYCCEIHSDNYNPDVPARIREALQRREQKLRDQNRSSTETIKQKGKPKKKGGKKK